MLIIGSTVYVESVCHHWQELGPPMLDMCIASD